MATNFLTKIFGSRNDRLIKQYRSGVVRINALEAELEKLPDDALRAKTQEFKQRVANGETLDALLPEAFAVVREGSKRDATHVRLARGGLDKQAAILPMVGKTKMFVTEVEVAPNSSPILVGRQASDPRPMAIDIPRRQACGCWASPCSGTGR